MFTQHALQLIILISNIIITVQSGNQEWSVNISSSSANSLYFYWNKCVGSGHGSLLLRSDWRQYMEDGHHAINFSYVRAHGILDDDVGSVNGINDYSFINIDKIYSYLLSIGMKPYVEISFMPDKLAKNASDTDMHYKANPSPPSSYNQWHDFIKTWIQHLVDYFSVDEVRTWYFEVWNEPNGKFWSGNYNDYVQLFNATATAIKSVDSKLMVGGPTTSGGFAWLDQFLNLTLSTKIPIDFVATHTYPNQHMNIQNVNTWPETIQSQAIDIVNKYNSKYNINLRLIISEYNSGLGVSHTNQDDNYAASFHMFWAKHLQILYPKGDKSVLQWMSWWAISDVFEEGGFNSNEFGNVYGMQTIRGTKKPSFRAFELLEKYGSEIEYKSKLIKDDNGFGNVSMSTSQVYCLKNRNDEKRYGIFIANWNNPDFNQTQQHLTINIGNYIENTSAVKSAMIYRIDSNHTAPLQTWKSMGSPEYPTNQQLDALNKSSQVVGDNIEVKKIDDNTLQIELDIGTYSAAVVDLQY